MAGEKKYQLSSGKITGVIPQLVEWMSGRMQHRLSSVMMTGAIPKLV